MRAYSSIPATVTNLPCESQRTIVVFMMAGQWSAAQATAIKSFSLNSTLCESVISVNTHRLFPCQRRTIAVSIPLYIQYIQ